MLNSFGTQGIQPLSASITLPGPLARSPFSLTTQGPITPPLTVKRGISVHFEICIRQACIIAACPSLKTFGEEVDLGACMSRKKTQRSQRRFTIGVQLNQRFKDDSLSECMVPNCRARFKPRTLG